METFVKLLRFLKVLSYLVQALYNYYLIGELLNVGYYLVCYYAELLVYFASLPLTVLSLSDSVLHLELPSNVSVKTSEANGMRRDLNLGRSSHPMSAYVGLDVHKDFTFATVLDQSRVVVQRKLANELVQSFLESFNVEKVWRLRPT